MNRILHFLFFPVCIFSGFFLPAQVYVAVEGNDFHDGSIERPKATLNAALRQVREMRRVSGDALAGAQEIILKGGIYHLEEPVFIRPEDTGSPLSPTIIRPEGNAEVVLSGGVEVQNWEPLTSKVKGLSSAVTDKIWVADFPEELYGQPPVRQMWVDGKKAVRARWPDAGKMERILSWDKEDESTEIPSPPMKISDTRGMEMFIHQWWEIAILRIKQVENRGDDLRLSFRQPESRIQSEHPWPAVWISEETGNSPFYLSNAMEFLDAPGEWYADISSRKIYYWPREDEDLREMEVMVPLLENLVKIEGTIDRPIRHIHFKNISFSHTAWNRPTLQGHVPHQAGMPMTDAYKLRPPGTPEKESLENQAWIERPEAAVKISFAHHTSFEECSFKHLASTGLDYHKGVKNNVINGNLFKDIGGSAILTGEFGEKGFEIHLSYNPEDERVVADSNTISNNFITDVTNEDWGSVGIGLGYTRHSLVIHNEIENVNYTGISMGWGWSPRPNVMRNNRIVSNKIHHYGKMNYDCAGIYTLSAQPGTVISDNYIDSIFLAPYAHLPSHWFYLYTDEGSSGITVRNNWTPSQKYLQNNNGPGNIWENNGPQVESQIKKNAGLSENYRYWQKEGTAKSIKLPVNTEHEELIEIVTRKGELDLDRLKRFLEKNKVNPESIYQWKNHYVIFDKIQDVLVFKNRLTKEFPETEVRPYYDMFYRFDPRGHCGDKELAEEQSHVLLTANLVEDEAKQKEYLDYHATQFEEWPEVARGFCNADFQSLMMFRRGRQLMLIITLPSGKTLAELDPKTVENNPRVEEWNRIMAQYQEGIEGTKEGEVWVFLDKAEED